MLQTYEAAKCQSKSFKSSLAGPNGRHFAGDIFKYIFVNKKFVIFIKKISFKFAPSGPVDNNPALV